MLVQTAILALLAAAPALVHAAPNPSGELSRRAAQTPLTPLGDLGVLSRARIGLPGPGGPNLAPAYMRKGVHYKQRKAGAIAHRHYGSDIINMERLLEEAEKLVNGLEEQLNKPKTLFPELEAAKRRMKKTQRTKMAAVAAKSG